jgi:transglutaminase-like putative cysteine protease
VSSVLYRIRHATCYRYAADVVHSHQLLRLVPRPVPFQECREHSIEVTPGAFRRRDGRDAFGNVVTRIESEHAHRELAVTATMDVLVHARAPVASADTWPVERVVGELDYGGRELGRDALEACRFRHESPYVRVKRIYDEYAAGCFAPGRPVLEAAQELAARIHREFAYAPGATTVATPLGEVLAGRRGVCQDFAHVMIACLRARGLPARYVSGYVRLPASGRDGGGERAGQSHAWVGVWCPPFGWVELDPTNDCRVGTDHVTVAWGRDFGDVSPLRGVILGGGRHEVAVTVHVRPAA